MERNVWVKLLKPLFHDGLWCVTVGIRIGQRPEGVTDLKFHKAHSSGELRVAYSFSVRLPVAL